MKIDILSFQFVKHFDFLSLPPSLKIDRKASYSTLFGGFISFIIFTLTIIGVVYFGSELLMKREPVAVVSAKDFDTLDFSISPSQYNIYLAIEDKNYMYYNDPTVFNITAYNDIILLDSEGTQNITRTYINIKTCSSIFKDESDLQMIDAQIDLDVFHCLEPNLSRVQGFWGNPINSYVGIIISKCENSTENSNHCKPQDEIDEKLQGGVLSIFSVNHILEMNNYDSPVRRIFENIFNSLNIEITFTMFIALRPLEFYSDGGFILKDISYLQTSYSEQPHILYYGRRESIIADVVIQGKPLGMKVDRSYTKFQDVLTKVGGLIKALTILGSFIIKYTSEIEFINDYIYKIKCRESSPAEPDSMTILDNYQNQRSSSQMHKNNFVAQDSGKRNVESSGIRAAEGHSPNQNFKHPKINLEQKSDSKLLYDQSFGNRVNQATEENKSSIKKIMNNPQTEYLPKFSIRRPTTQIITGSSSIKYKTCDSLKDFFIQIWCFMPNHPSKRTFQSMKNRIDNSLSVETILEKTFLVDIINSSVFSTEQRLINNQYYIKSMKQSSKEDISMMFALIK